MGAGVSLVPRSTTKHYFCFQLVSGVTKLVMQALTVEDMMDWAVTLYHAIAIANGGSYILGVERAEEQRRQKEEEARLRLEDAQRQLRAAEEEKARLRRQRDEEERIAREQLALRERQRLEREQREALEAAERARIKAEELLEDAGAEVAQLELEKEEDEKRKEQVMKERQSAAAASIQDAMDAVDGARVPSEEAVQEDVGGAGEEADEREVSVSLPVDDGRVSMTMKYLEEEEEEEDGEDDDTDEAKAEEAAAARAPEPPRELTEENLRQVFHSLDVGSNVGQLNAMQFSALLRAITGEANLFFEMQTFNRFSGGEAEIDEVLFVRGFIALQADTGDSAQRLLRGIGDYAEHSSVLL